MFKIDSKEKALDCAIRDFEIKGDTSKCGYKIEDKAPYENYMSNKTWTSFLNEMPKLYRRQYEDGDGGELEEKKGRYGLYPPKMASYGSSSRLIYQCSRNIKGFSFEKQLPTRVGHIANIDGYKPKNDQDVYVEAKCREIYANHTDIEINEVYKKVFDFIHKKHPCFEFEPSSCKKEHYFHCTFKYNEQIIVHFDIKQLICHFLGIAANILENKQTKGIRFVYFIYNPDKVKENIEKYRKEILSIYQKTIEEISQMGDMSWLFEAVLEFQKQNLGLSLDKTPSFEFLLTDQDGYKDAIEKD